MKRSLLSVVLLSAAAAVPVFAADQSKSSASAPATATKQVKLVRVATINTAQANREFQANVQVLQAERVAAAELNQAMEKETNAAKKKELKTKLDAAIAKLNADNETMTKMYGFSLARNYILEIEKANIYMEVSDEEAAKIEAQEKAKQGKK